MRQGIVAGSEKRATRDRAGSKRVWSQAPRRQFAGVSCGSKPDFRCLGSIAWRNDEATRAPRNDLGSRPLRDSGGMFRLVETDRASAREVDRGCDTPLGLEN